MSRIIKKLQDLQFSDDFMFGAIMRDPYICKGVLERLLQIKIDHIEYTEVQKVLEPYYSKKGIRLDVYVEDSNTVYDVEMQTGAFEDLGKRSRYYQAVIDMDHLIKGQHYSELKQSIVIFLCLGDPFNQNEPIYTFSMQCKENRAAELNDKVTHIMYNCHAAADELDPERKALLNYISSQQIRSDFAREIDEMITAKKLSEEFSHDYAIMYLKEMDLKRESFKDGKEEGLKEGLAKGIEQGIEQGIELGREEGAQQKAIESARNFLAKGISAETVAECTGLNIKQVQQLADNI